MVDLVPGEVLAVIGGAAIYVLFYLFGHRGGAPLRKQKPARALGIGLVILGMGLMVMAALTGHYSETPLRALDENRALPEFLRHGYWFSIVCMSFGACEIARAALNPPRSRKPSFRLRRVR